MKATPEELIAEFKQERRLIEEGADNRIVAKTMRKLAPAFGLSKSLISRAWDVADGGDLLDAIKADQEEGHLIPPGLIIGGHKGLKYGDILAAEFSKKRWWAKFMEHVETYGEAIWILPIAGAGYWVIHNTTVNPNKRRHAVEIPAYRAGLNHIQVIRLELFIEEKRYD